MKRSLIQVLASLLCAATALFCSATVWAKEGEPATFYYAYSRKILLTALDNKVIIRYASAAARQQPQASLWPRIPIKQAVWRDERTVIITTDAAANARMLLETVRAHGTVLAANAVYALPKGGEAGITDEFIVKFLPTAPDAKIKALIAETGSVVKSAGSGITVLTAPQGSSALALANLYQESGLAVYAHPNFYEDVVQHQATTPATNQRPINPITGDEYYGQQFYLHNTGQVTADGRTGTVGADIKAPEAWRTTLGSGSVVVAVLDDGLSGNHPDLPSTRQVRLPGSNFADGNANDPSPYGYNAHGNHCAGVIAATKDNGQGIAGIAPYCKIMPVRIFNSSNYAVDDNGLANAILFAKNNGADVISCSWGNGARDPQQAPVIVDAIRQATTLGRNGKGCVVVFSAGNNANHVAGNDGYASFPSNVDVPGVLTVGASDRNDAQANYSPTGDPGSSDNNVIDVVAPSHKAYPGQIPTETFEVWTIDIEDLGGDNPWPAWLGYHPPAVGEQLPGAGTNYLAYTGRFGGTSAACPQVAGIAALMLSVNPNLKQLQVANLIRSSADKVGGYAYSNGVSTQLGYGRVNACAAVRQAFLALTVAGPEAFCAAYGTASYALSSPSPGPYTWTSSNPQAATIDTYTGQATAVGAGFTTFTATGVAACGVAPSVSISVRVGEVVPTGTYQLGTNVPVALQTVQFISIGQLVKIAINQPYIATHPVNQPYDFTFTTVTPSGLPPVPVTKTGLQTAQFYFPDASVQIIATAANAPCPTSSSFVFAKPNYRPAALPNPADTELAVLVAELPQSAQAGQPVEIVEKKQALDAEVQLYNSMGLLVRTQRATDAVATVDVRSLPEGIYTLRTRIGADVTSQHIQITH